MKILTCLLFTAIIACVSTCSETFAQKVPPAPDYANKSAWAAWPGRRSDADAVPQGAGSAKGPAALRADVFFIHPTTELGMAAGNVRYDEPGRAKEWLDHGVLRFQASAFNACCRIFAPRYRQATLAAFLSFTPQAEAAFSLAYADVLRAFDYYMAHENRGRPFIIASHSQGSLHAMRLLQERIIGTPLKGKLLAAYVVGSGLPADIEKYGLPICASPFETGCAVNWNSVEKGKTIGLRGHTAIWLDGHYQEVGGREIACVNPLNWVRNGEANAGANLGSLPAARAGQPMPASIPQLTGAECSDGLLGISIPANAKPGFTDFLTKYGSYHVFDYNLFYMNIRKNALERASAFISASR